MSEGKFEAQVFLTNFPNNSYTSGGVAKKTKMNDYSFIMTFHPSVLNHLVIQVVLCEMLYFFYLARALLLIESRKEMKR